MNNRDRTYDKTKWLQGEEERDCLHFNQDKVWFIVTIWSKTRN